MRESARLDWLDALRGWAVLAVVLVHSGQAAHCTGILLSISAAGQYGVQLFFIVSALTISATYEAHIGKYGASRMSQFAWLIKRFFRIAPLYYAAAIFYPIEHYAIYVLSRHAYGNATAPADIIANLVFVHTWVPSANNSVVPGGWSIGVEMFFYLLVPFIWLLPLRRRIAGLCATAAFFLAATMIASKLSTGRFYVEDNSYLYYWFPTQAPVLVVGLVFYFHHGLGTMAPQRPLFYFCGFAAGLLIARILGTGAELAPMLAPVTAAFSFVLLVMSLRGPLKPVLVNRHAVYFGKISFSIYIFHFVVLDFIRAGLLAAHFHHSDPFTLGAVFATALLATCRIAQISKRIIEDPGIAYGHKLSHAVALRREPVFPA